MAELRIIGEPKATYDFVGLQSWNVSLTQHWTKKGEITKELRTLAHDLAMMVKDRLDDWEKSLPLIETAMMVVYVYPPRETEVSDIHNVNIKAITDGFTDAGIWEDDEWAYVPATLFLWAGIDENGERRARIELYELNGIFINGRGLILPNGRFRND